MRKLSIDANTCSFTNTLKRGLIEQLGQNNLLDILNLLVLGLYVRICEDRSVASEVIEKKIIQRVNDLLGRLGKCLQCLTPRDPTNHNRGFN